MIVNVWKDFMKIQNNCACRVNIPVFIVIQKIIA